MDFKTLLTAGFDLVRFKSEALIDIQHDPELYKTGLTLVVLPALLTGLLALNLYALVVGIVMNLLMFSLMVAVTHGVARMFGGDTYIGNTCTAMSGSGFFLMLAVFVVSIFVQMQIAPTIMLILYVLIAFYIFAVQIFIIKHLYNLPYWKAVLTLILPIAFISYLSAV